jgi:Ca-activated chloride channel family protein
MVELIKIISGISFEEPWWLALLPLMAVFFVAKRLTGRRPRPAVLFPAVETLRREGLAVHPLVARLPALFRWMAMVAGVLALSGPRAPFPPASLKSNGIDIMLALDVSESMQQSDFDGRIRFSAAQDAARQFIESRSSDRIGLVVFSGGSFARCPLTLDHSVLRRLVETITPGFFQEQGTAIGTAILTSVNRLKASESKEKVLVLLTDGENNAGEVSPVTAARLAAQSGVRIYTVFAGKSASHHASGGTESGLLSDQGRNELGSVARISGGSMFSAGDTHGLKRTFQEIDRLEKSRLKGSMLAHTAELYPWLLMSAALMLIVEVLLSATRFIRIP